VIAVRKPADLSRNAQMSIFHRSEDADHVEDRTGVAAERNADVADRNPDVAHRNPDLADRDPDVVDQDHDVTDENPEVSDEKRAAAPAGATMYPDRAGEAGLDAQAVVERQRERYGGVKVGAAFFGWLTAMGTAVLLTALLAAAGAVGAVTASAERPRARAARSA
jgi:hypothetical protein